MNRSLFFLLLLVLSPLLILFQTPPAVASTSWTGFTPINSTLEDELRPPLLQEVVREIATSQSWSPRDVRVLELDARRARVGKYLSYEIRVRTKKMKMEFNFADEVADWKRISRKIAGRADLKRLVSRIRNGKAILDKFMLEGPFELRATGDAELSVQVPLNKMHTGLRRILIGEGVTVEVGGAEEISLFQNSCPERKPGIVGKREGMKLWQLLYPSCMSVPSVTVSGAVILLAKAKKPESSIDVTFVSERIIELLLEKCYSERIAKRVCPVVLLRSKVAMVDKLVRSLHAIGHKNIRQGIVGCYFLSSRIKASKVARFRIELERNVRRFDDIQTRLAKWRTRPSIERAWFEVVAKYRSGGGLKPLSVRKLKPFILVDSAPWSNLLFNISFTKFPSLLLPPEALTLDIKW